MPSPLLLLNDHVDQPQVLSTAGGDVALVSQAAPGAEGPNEDSALILPTERGFVLAVADGAGGCAEGEKASRLSIETLQRLVDPARPDARAEILDAFEASNRAVLGLGSGAATTLSVVHLHCSERGTELRSFHAGDSSVLVTGGRGRVKLNTIPHSPVGYAVEAGLIDQEAALHHSDLNLVSNLVGQADMRIEMGSTLTLATRDTVVVGTDGLFDNVHLWEIVQLARRGPLLEAAAKLRELATHRMLHPTSGLPSKPDDLTFALYRPRRTARLPLKPHKARVRSDALGVQLSA